MKPSDHNGEVITSDNRVVGCRGRVLVAVLILAALALILTATLLYRLFTWTPPVPRQAAIDTNSSMATTVHLATRAAPAFGGLAGPGPDDQATTIL